MKHKTPPHLTVGVNGPVGTYALAGFEDFERWMMLNDPHYNAAAKDAESIGMNEADRLRYLLWIMARKSAQSQATLMDHIKRN